MTASPAARFLTAGSSTFLFRIVSNESYSADEQKRNFEPLKSTILSLTEILEQAQQRLKKMIKRFYFFFLSLLTSTVLPKVMYTISPLFLET